MSTGYSGTGMTCGTLSAMLPADVALERENRFAALYDPGRRKIGSILENVVTKATEFPKRMIARASTKSCAAVRVTARASTRAARS